MPLDKIAHALAGAVIALLAAPFGIQVAGGLVVAAAVGKEVVDKFRHGKPDHVDSLATIVGGVAAFGLDHGVVLLQAMA